LRTSSRMPRHLALNSEIAMSFIGTNYTMVNDHGQTACLDTRRDWKRCPPVSYLMRVNTVTTEHGLCSFVTPSKWDEFRQNSSHPSRDLQFEVPGLRRNGRSPLHPVLEVPAVGHDVCESSSPKVLGNSVSLTA
jgi:hypothetical protein